LRAVFVNHCHPDTPHVCAVRAREFAEAFARRGHQVVLLTATLLPEDATEPPADLRGRLGEHDWQTPFRLACAPRGHVLLRRQRAGGLPGPLGKLMVAGYYGALGTVFADWGRGAAPCLPVVAEKFRPDVVWANFGSTETLRIGRALAARAGCPWVLDVKDYWTSFIPPMLRRSVGRRFAGAAAMTALSEGHVADSRGVLPDPLTGATTVVHSGVPEALVQASAPASVDPQRIVLTGAIYETDWLDAILAGIARAGAELGLDFAVHYAGDRGRLVRDRARAVGGLNEPVDHGYLPLDRLAELQRGALLNAFVRSGPAWFQHKVPELLAAGRPILCVAPADAETRALCRRTGVQLYDATTAVEVAMAVAAVRGSPAAPPDPEALAALTWDSRAGALETALQNAADAARR
jgi:hypothetical protein